MLCCTHCAAAQHAALHIIPLLTLCHSQTAGGLASWSPTLHMQMCFRRKRWKTWSGWTKKPFGIPPMQLPESTWSISFRYYLCRANHLFTFCLLVKYIPSWVPGAGFQCLAARTKQLCHVIHHKPWEKVLKDIVSWSCSDLRHSKVVIGLWNSLSQPCGQIFRTLRCHCDNKGFGGSYLYGWVIYSI